MHSITTIFRREMASYFATPVAYVFIVIFMCKQSSLFRSVIKIISLWILAIYSKEWLNKIAPQFHYPFCVL